MLHGHLHPLTRTTNPLLSCHSLLSRTRPPSLFHHTLGCDPQLSLSNVPSYSCLTQSGEMPWQHETHGIPQDLCTPSKNKCIWQRNRAQYFTTRKDPRFDAESKSLPFYVGMNPLRGPASFVELAPNVADVCFWTSAHLCGALFIRCAS